jgi:hypothetical protein
VKVTVPFVGTVVNIPDPCYAGGGLDESIKAVQDLLNPVFPLLQLAACAMKLVDIAIGIPDAMGPPPSPSKVIQLVQDVETFVTQCIPFLLTLTPIGAVIQVVCFIVGICQFLIGLLNCIMSFLVHLLTLSVDAQVCLGSSDLSLQAMGRCLNLQSTAMQGALQNQMTALNCVFTILNGILKTMTAPLSQVGVDVSKTCITLNLNTSVGITALQQEVAVVTGALQAIISLVTPICSGASSCPPPTC